MDAMTENQPTIAEPVDPSGTATGTSETPGAGSQSSSGPSYGPPPPYAPPYPPAKPSLRRSRTDRVLTGVCGGLAENLGIDAVLIRILVVVGTVFTGGALIIAYLIAWALMPDSPAYVVPVPPAAAGAPTSFAAGGTGTYVDPATGTVYGPPAPVAPAPRTEPRSYLGLIAVSASILVGGLFAVLIAAGVSVPAVVVASSMLLVIGLGLLVGAFRGRAKWLIIPAIVLLLVTQGTAAASRFEGSTGDVTWTPTASGESYQLGAGTARLDLASLPAGDVTLDVSIGAGEIVVILPPDVALEIDSSIGAGEARMPGERPQGGIGLDTSFSVPAESGTATTTVELNSSIGLGTLEVRREAS